MSIDPEDATTLKRPSEDDEESFDSPRPTKRLKADRDSHNEDDDDEEDSQEIDVEEEDSPVQKRDDATSELKGIKVELEGRELWERFNELGTEMIITKAGRYVWKNCFQTLSTRPPQCQYSKIA